MEDSLWNLLSVFWPFSFHIKTELRTKGPVIIEVEAWGGAGGVEAEKMQNAFDAKIFPDPNLIAFMFFGYPLQLFETFRTRFQT